MSMQSIVSTDPVPCKICKAPAPLYGVVDFHKSCAEIYGSKFPLSGIPVYYRRCESCHFLFTDMFDDWSMDDFKRYIYNDTYGLADIRYEEKRPTENAILIDRLFGAHKSEIQLVDYGGGNGKLVEVLKRSGFKAEAYDPFSQSHSRRPDVKANIMTCFEVLEHGTKPYETVDDLVSFFGEEGLLVFSTFVQPKDFDSHGLNWWYVGPRNGHVSIFSHRSLRLLFGSRGYMVASSGDNFHIAYRKVPPFAANIFQVGKASGAA